MCGSGYLGITGGTFTEVSCIGVPSIIEHLKQENNIYRNPFGTEIAQFRTSEKGVSRMGVTWDTPGDEGERGRRAGKESGEGSAVSEGRSTENMKVSKKSCRI